MPRTRTTKKLAQRIDLNYFKRPSPLWRWRVWLAIGLPVLAVIWLVWHGIRRDDTVYSSGRLSTAHAVLNADCAACHVREAGRFSAAATDSACLACHDGPVHKDTQTFTPTCVSCHVDHRGPVRLAETPDASCTQCHVELHLHTRAVPPNLENVSAFDTHHPEFAALRGNPRDPGTIRLNHEVHLKPDLRGPGGNPVQLECSDCHRMPAYDNRPWPFGRVESRPGGPELLPDDRTRADRSLASSVSSAAGGRLMEPVKYEKACAACHALQFDKRFPEGVPHGKQPAETHAFLLKKFQEYIAARPSELRSVREPDRNLTGRPMPPRVRVLTPARWVEEKTSEAEELLWRKTCKQCHALAFPPQDLSKSSFVVIEEPGVRVGPAVSKNAPIIAKPKILSRWMPHAKFSHAAHQMLTCTSCHAATTSKETSDVLMPGIATCQSCHKQSANGAESRCFLCHTYHDWSKEKPVRGKLRLHGISGSRPLKPGEQKVAIE